MLTLVFQNCLREGLAFNIFLWLPLLGDVMKVMRLLSFGYIWLQPESLSLEWEIWHATVSILRLCCNALHQMTRNRFQTSPGWMLWSPLIQSRQIANGISSCLNILLFCSILMATTSCWHMWMKMSDFRHPRGSPTPLFSKGEGGPGVRIPQTNIN